MSQTNTAERARLQFLRLVGNGIRPDQQGILVGAGTAMAHQDHRYSDDLYSWDWLPFQTGSRFDPQFQMSDLQQISRSVRRYFPGGVDLAVIVPTDNPGWRRLHIRPGPATNPNGQNLTGTPPVAILVGMLLPAIQKVREAANRNVLSSEIMPLFGPVFIGGWGASF